MSALTFVDADEALRERIGRAWGPVVAAHMHLTDGFTLVALDTGEPVGLVSVAWRALPPPLPDTIEGFIDIIEVRPGFGFLPGTIVDQHFLRRERHNRLLAAVLERPGLIGIGIDEGTALEVGRDGTWRVRGASAVSIYDARGARVTRPGAPVLGGRGVRLALLPPGSSFNPVRGEAALAGE